MNLQRAFSSISYNTTIATTDDQFYICGQNGEGQLGLGTKEEETAFRRLELPGPVHILAGGYNHNIALMVTGELYGWGRNSYGNLGLGYTSSKENLPKRICIPDDTNIIFVDAGAHHSVALAEDGGVFAWGQNTTGELGLGDNNNRATPCRVLLPKKITRVACGACHTIALTEDGEVYVWGQNSNCNQLGIQTCENIYNPLKHILLTTKIVSIACGANYTIVISDSGQLYAWGHNNYGQLGLGDTAQRSIPELIPLPDKITDIACSHYHNLAIAEDGSLWAWGNNGAGQLGLGDTEHKYSPRHLTLPSGVRSVAVGYYHSYAVSNAGDVYVWGENHSGQLGLGNRLNVHSPKLVPGYSPKEATWPDPYGKNEKWRLMAQWLFMGNSDKYSSLSEFPKEVVYHFVTVLINKY
jgi:alpha-tubulin suppressor-like RCC1 family protein